MVLVRFAARDDLAVRHGQIDANVVVIAVAMMPVQSLHGDAAGHDVVVVLFELVRAPPDPGLDGLGTVEVSEGNLQGELHGPISWPGPPKMM
jgi:hypothetical protein